MKYLKALFLLLASQAQAMDVWVGGNGVWGMPVTPTATLATGSLIYQLQNRVIGTERTEGLNHSFVVGLSSFSELGLRTADNTTARNMYDAGGGGLRDLSASAKVQINPLLGLQRSDLKLAAGVTDYGGAATNFRSYYGVATYDRATWAASAGYAKSTSNSNFNPLNGLFANASVKISSWLSLRTEANHRHAWAGATISNQSLLASINAPAGTKLYLNIDKQWRGSPISGSKPWIGVGIHLPLDWTGMRPAQETQFQLTSTVEPEPSLQNEVLQRCKSSCASDTSGVTHAKLSQLEVNFPSTAQNTDQESGGLDKFDSKVSLGAEVFANLASDLAKEGFEGIDVGYVNDQVVVKFSDFVFDHSSLDGAGVALGVISKAWPELEQSGFENYKIVYARWGTPTMAFKGQLQCLYKWLKELNCARSQAVQVEFRNIEQSLSNVNWKILNHEPYQFKPRIVLNPLYSYYWATEYSLLDYSLGINIKPYFHLWDGGALEFSRSEHLKSSLEFSTGHIYNYSKIASANRRMMLHHMQKLSDGFSARLSVGQLFTGPHQGAQGVLRWDSLDGQWAGGLNASRWVLKNREFSETQLPTGSPKILFARYAPVARDWSLEVQAGQYWFKDKGLSVISTHWFGDTNFSYFLRRSVPPTQFWSGAKGVTLAGFEITFPLTSTKAMNAQNFQIKGVNRIGLGLVTPIGRADNYIVGANGVPIYIKALVDTPIPEFLGFVLMDSDRANASYVNAHLDRLRLNFLQWSASGMKQN